MTSYLDHIFSVCRTPNGRKNGPTTQGQKWGLLKNYQNLPKISKKYIQTQLKHIFYNSRLKDKIPKIPKLQAFS